MRKDLQRFVALIRQNRAERRKEVAYPLKALREREKAMGQVCIYCGHRKPLTEFDIRNICRLCVAEAKKEAPRGKSYPYA